MGLFDFFKKKKPAQPSSEIQQEPPAPPIPEYKESVKMESALEDAMTEQTALIIRRLKQKKSVAEFLQTLDELSPLDRCDKAIVQAAKEQFVTYLPKPEFKAQNAVRMDEGDPPPASTHRSIFALSKEEREKIRNEALKTLDEEWERSLDEKYRKLAELKAQNAVKMDEGDPPLSTLLKTATPSKQGLYPHEILMLEYAHYFKTSNNKFQEFWYWRYSVTDPQSVLDSLFERGFIDVSELRPTLEKLRLPEIKEELKQINQNVTGRKAELIDRLMEFGDLAALNQKYSVRRYVLTQKGKQELEDNQYVSYLHRNTRWDMTIWEMNQRIAKTHAPYRTIIWDDLNERSLNALQNSNFGTYSFTRFKMCLFLMEEDEYVAAFHLLCEYLSFELSGLCTGYEHLLERERSNPECYLEVYELLLDEFFSSNIRWVICPAQSSCFAQLRTIFDLNDEEYREALLKELHEIHPPRRIFTDEEYADIVIANLHNDTDTLTAIYERAEKREREKFEELKSRIKK